MWGCWSSNAANHNTHTSISLWIPAANNILCDFTYSWSYSAWCESSQGDEITQWVTTVHLSFSDTQFHRHTHNCGWCFVHKLMLLASAYVGRWCTWIAWKIPPLLTLCTLIAAVHTLVLFLLQGLRNDPKTDTESWRGWSLTVLVSQQLLSWFMSLCLDSSAGVSLRHFKYTQWQTYWYGFTTLVLAVYFFALWLQRITCLLNYTNQLPTIVTNSRLLCVGHAHVLILNQWLRFLKGQGQPFATVASFRV